MFGQVLLVHIGVVTLFLLFSFLKGCFKPRPKPEIVTFIELGEAAVQRNPVELVPVPEPVVDPVREPAPIKKKPSWKPTPVNEIRKGKRVTSAPAMPKLDASTIDKALAEVKPIVGSSDPFAVYSPFPVFVPLPIFSLLLLLLALRDITFDFFNSLEKLLNFFFKR